MKAVFPGGNGKALHKDPEAESEMETISGIITGIRNIRGEMNISPSKALSVKVQSDDEAKRRLIESHSDLITNLAKLESFTVSTSGNRPKSAAVSLAEGAVIFVLLEGVIDFSKEEVRLEKEMSRLNKDLEAVRNKLGNNGFIQKAPEHVIREVRERSDELGEKQRKLQANLARIRELQNN